MRAVVTGAGAGNGRAIALAVARQGADVFLASLYETELGEVAREISAFGRRVWTRAGALDGFASGEAMVDAALGDMGRIDIMINNVGGASNVDGGVSSLRHATEDWYRKLFATNLEVPIAASRRAAEATIESGDCGAIINIASINARGPSPTLAFYAAGKAALVSIY